MTEEDAKLLLKAAFEASSVLNDVAAELSDRLDRDEAKAVRINIGYALTEIGDRLFTPVFAAHPLLEPDNTADAWRDLAQKVGARDMRVE